MNSKHIHEISEIVRKSLYEHKDFKEWTTEELLQGLSISIGTFITSAAKSLEGKVTVSSMWEHFKSVTDMALMVIECKNEIDQERRKKSN